MNNCIGQRTTQEYTHTHRQTGTAESGINTRILNCSRNYLYFSAFLVSTGCAALVALNATWPQITLAFLLHYISAAARCLGFSVAVGFGLGLRHLRLCCSASLRKICRHSHFCHFDLMLVLELVGLYSHDLGLFAAC